MNSGPPPLLYLDNLRVSFATKTGRVQAVDGISLAVPAGRMVALVGESGCGKSATALSILRLLPVPPGRIEGRMFFSDGRVDLLTLTPSELRRVRGGKIAMIFQEPASALNPVLTIGVQIAEAVEHHRGLRGKAAWAEAVELLRKVGIAAPEQRVRDYPHRMSGGMLQRVMIAMALAGRPALLIADEPTTALDVTVQGQVLELLKMLQAEQGMSILLITHDLGVVASLADEVYVMYAGRIVEHGATDQLLGNPLHPYTRGLLECVPKLRDGRERFLAIPGQVPSPRDFPAGCRFHPRCELTVERARSVGAETVTVQCEVGGRVVLRRCVEGSEGIGRQPPLREAAPNHAVACWEVP